MKSAIYVSDSGNTKLSGTKSVDTTYASIKSSCPSSCPLKDGKACYAELGYVGFVTSRLDKVAKGLSALEVAREEARAIDYSYNGKAVPQNRDLRIHTAGDSRTVKGTKLINSAIGRWKKRGGGIAWSYTHSWKNIKRSLWSNASVLASVSNTEEANEARKQGYAPAIIVSEFNGDKAFKIDGSSVKWIPCPAQTKNNIGCVDCRLCMRSEFLYKSNVGIAFAAHGVKKNNLKKRLEVIK
jgi:hypothetical protein